MNGCGRLHWWPTHWLGSNALTSQRSAEHTSFHGLTGSCEYKNHRKQNSINMMNVVFPYVQAIPQ